MFYNSEEYLYYEECVKSECIWVFSIEIIVEWWGVVDFLYGCYVLNVVLIIVFKWYKIVGVSLYIGFMSYLELYISYLYFGIILLIRLIWVVSSFSYFIWFKFIGSRCVKLNSNLVYVIY